MSLFSDSLRQVGRRIGRSKKIVDGSFPGGATGREVYTELKGFSKMPEELRDVDTSIRLRNEYGPPKAIGADELDEYLAMRRVNLPNRPATDEAQRWASETGRKSINTAGPRGLLSEEERSSLFKPVGPRQKGTAAEEWLRAQSEIEDFGPRENSRLINPRHYDVPVSGEQLEERGLPLASTLRRRLDYGAETVGRKVNETYTSPIDFRSDPGSGGTTGVWAEPPIMKRTVDVTDAQWQRYLERINDRTPSGKSETRVLPGQGQQQVPLGQGADVAREAMGGEIAPSVNESLFSRIKTPNPEKDQRIGARLIKGYDTQDLPKEEAYQKLLQDNPAMGGSGELVPHDQAIPPARVLSNREGGPQYQERKYQSVGPAVQQAVESLKAAKATGKTPMAGEDLAKKTTALEDLWTFIGKGGSVEGRMWNKLRQSAAGGGRYKVANTKDYFFRVGFKWMADKKATASKYPREVRLLEDAWAQRHKVD